ncbi:MAG: hypothetical protein ACYS3S_23330 [Planctomycetota bacterium]|jgi:hypothetical protein
MKTYKIFITGLVILVTTSGAKASHSKTWSHLVGTGHTNVTNLAIDKSSSNSYVFDSLENSDTDSMSGMTTDTSAYAAIARSSGSVETKSFDLYAKAITIPDVLTDSRSWDNIAEQFWTFQAAEDGFVRFDFTYDFSYELETEVSGEWAYADIYVDLHLYPVNLGPWDYWSSGCHTIRTLQKVVSDGDDFKTQASVPISVGTIFTAGENLCLWIRVQHYAGAATIVPSPPAVEILIEQLIAQVKALNLQQGISNSLDAKLDAVKKALDDVNENNDAAGINALETFINAVEAQRGNKILDEDADALIEAAQEIIDLLRNG